MKKPNCNQEINLTIQDLGSHGEGVGFWDGYAVFVDGALPGEFIQARLFEIKKRCGRGRLQKLIEASEDRVKPSCSLADRCGGCQIMHLSYEKQLEIKKKRVIAALERIGKLFNVEVLSCLPSPSPLHYRNKIQLFTNHGAKGIEIGFYERLSHKLIPVQECRIHCSLGEEIFQKLKGLLHKTDLRGYDKKGGKGQLCSIILRTTLRTKQCFVVLVTNSHRVSQKLLDLAKAIFSCHPAIKGVIQKVEFKRGRPRFGKEYHLLEGVENIYEELCLLSFKVSPASFFQVNPLQAEAIYREALRCAQVCQKDIVLDAYCGVGTLASIFSFHVQKVYGIECSREAIEDANENVQMNGIRNVEFICGLAEEEVKSIEGIDILLINPPRKGCELSFLKEVERLSPRRIVYISCDPATLSRDLAILKGFSYSIGVIQPFDMFPQTAHVECLVALEKDFSV